MHGHAIDLTFREAQYVKRGGREPSGITAEQPLGSEHDAIIGFGISRIIDDIFQQMLGPAMVLLVEPDKRVSVHQGRVIETGVGEDQGR